MNDSEQNSQPDLAPDATIDGLSPDAQYERYSQKVTELINPKCNYCLGRGVVHFTDRDLVCRCVEKRLARLGYKSVKEYCESSIIVKG